MTKKCLFGLPEEKNFLGMLVDRHIREIERHYSCVHVEKYVVMPNHVHMILVLEKGQQANVEQVIGQFKAGITRELRRTAPQIRIWQRSFHDHVIRNPKDYALIWTYIENNPEKWKEDCFFPDKNYVET